jgi:glycosyltransferase involved in cell wall biosynthesis
MDLYVCPSASESMSNAVLEALASGLPVVTTNVGDHALTVRDEVEGRVVEKLDPARIADAILDLMLNPQGRFRMSVASRIRAESLSFDRMTERYRVFYDNILTLSKGPGEEKSAGARLSKPIGWSANHNSPIHLKRIPRPR